MLKNIKNNLLLILKAIPYFLRAIWLFFPGIVFLLLALFALVSLGQGRDVVRHCLERPNWVGAIMVLAVIFWVFVTWYTARLVAYNNNELFVTKLNNGVRDFNIGEKLLYHGPRLIAFFIFFVLIIAFYRHDRMNEMPNLLITFLLLLELFLYFFFHHYFTKYEKQKADAGKVKVLIGRRNMVRSLILLACCIIVIFWGNKWVLIIMTALLQFGFLFLIIIRRSIALWNRDAVQKHLFLDGYLNWVFDKDRLKNNPWLHEMRDAERSIFFYFNLIALVCMAFYFASLFSLSFSRYIGPLAFIFLAFAVLLGVGNLLALLSQRWKTNVHLILLAFLFIVGLFSEPHRVSLLKQADEEKNRPGFREYLREWVNDSSRKQAILADTNGYPVFFVLADGGASRSGYWTALVLSKLTDETKNFPLPFYKHLFCLSGASGGSVGNGVYMASLMHKDSLLKAGSGFRQASTEVLSSDFLTFTLARMLGPDIAAPLTYKIFGGDRGRALEQSLEHPVHSNYLAKDISGPFSSLYPAKDKYLFPITVFNSTRMQDGSPAVICNIDLDSAAFGNRIDIIDSLPKANMIRLSSAMALSARFPYISPAGKIGNDYFVDGGYFDNSGAGVVHEMLLEINRIKRLKLMPTEDSALHKLRFYVIHIINSPYSSGKKKRVHPFNNDLAAPLITMAGSYESQTSVNNTRLQKYLSEQQPGSYIEFNLYKRDSAESFPMNWVMSNHVIKAMNRRVENIEALNRIIQKMKKNETELFRGLDVQNEPQN
ncbi:MAG: patatin-like phospholipase family protein [Ferruginibacter sp.]